MRRVIHIMNHERGPRVYVVGRRIHHGAAFGVAAALTWRCRPLSAACATIALTDWRDFPFRDCDNH